MKFEIFLLGTSAGIPSKERNLPCIAIRFDGNLYLFDSGECCQKQLIKYRVGYGRIRNIFISHLHLDHFLGVFGLIETLRMTTDIEHEKLNLYAPEGFSKLLINKWDFLSVNKLKQGLLKKEGDVKLYAFKNKHRGESYGFVLEEEDRVKINATKASSLGIKGKMFSEIIKKGEVKVKGKTIKLEEISKRIKGRKIVYSGDTAYSENTIKFAKDADILIHEATFSEEFEEEAKKTRHSTTKDAAMIAKNANAKTLVLTHISARYKKEEEERYIKEVSKYYKGKTIIAYDGLRITL